jgi:hypothetical protein
LLREKPLRIKFRAGTLKVSCFFFFNFWAAGLWPGGQQSYSSLDLTKEKYKQEKRMAVPEMFTIADDKT